jgi:hypothetical protein
MIEIRWVILRVSRARPVAILTAALAATACGKAGGGPGGVSPLADSSVAYTGDTVAPPRAPGCPKLRPPQNQEELDRCTSTLKFDTAPEAGDEQRLLVLDSSSAPPCMEDPKHTCSYGPLARIEPVLNAHKYRDEPDMNEGRIIARLFVRQGEPGYPKLGLLPGHMTYWWVQFSPGATTGQAYFVTDSLQAGQLLSTRKRTVKVKHYPPGTLKQALADWLWTIEDETAQGRCGSASCR